MNLAGKTSGNRISVWGRNATCGTGIEELYQHLRPIGAAASAVCQATMLLTKTGIQ